MSKRCLRCAFSVSKHKTGTQGQREAQENENWPLYDNQCYWLDDSDSAMVSSKPEQVSALCSVTKDNHVTIRTATVSHNRRGSPGPNLKEKY